jgi:hypothetical protein
MMRIKCPKCAKLLGIDETKAGATAVCPQCQAKFRIPAASSPPAGGAKPASAQTAAPKAADPPPPADTKPWQAEDDFQPYLFRQEEPGLSIAASERRGDELAEHAMRKRRRERAWEAVGGPAKLIARVGLIGVSIASLAFAWVLMAAILYEHKLHLAEKAQAAGQATPTGSATAPGGQPGRQEPDKPLWPLSEFVPDLNTWQVVGIFAGGWVVLLIIYGLQIAGAEKMKRLDSYGWAMTACIIATFSSILVGLFGLLALMDRSVKAEFAGMQPPADAAAAGAKKRKQGAHADEEDDEDEDEEEEEPARRKKRK